MFSGVKVITQGDPLTGEVGRVVKPSIRTAISGTINEIRRLVHVNPQPIKRYIGVEIRHHLLPVGLGVWVREIWECDCAWPHLVPK